MITIQWTSRDGKIRNTTFKASTATRFIVVLETAGYDWKVVGAEGEVA